MSPTTRFTIGVLSGWQYYWTATPLSYLNPIYRGIRQAAADLGCNLLLGCGMGPSATSTDPMRPAWPTLSPEADFVPIGPWNTNGIIAINPLHSAARSAYLQDLLATGYPVVFVASGEAGPTIVADNAAGIREAMRHLVAHGHRAIAFIAGSPEDMVGDTGARLQAYHAALHEHGLVNDVRLTAWGRHTSAGGYAALRQIMDAGVAFTALLASNDESALGAMQALKEAGRRVPQDVAIIGFDDRPESAVQEPALTSVTVPLFEMGYRAVTQIIRQSQKHAPAADPVNVATHLVVRESCGCGRHHVLSAAAPGLPLAAALTEPAEINTLRQRLTTTFITSVEQDDPAALLDAIDAIFRQTAQGWDEAAIWQAAFTVVSDELPALLDRWTETTFHERARHLLEEARVVIATSTWQRHREYVVDQRWTFDRVGVLTARLLTALDESQVYDVLAHHLPEMNIQLAAVTIFEPEGENPAAWGQMRMITPPGQTIRFPCRDFPPAGMFPPDRPFSLALLPLVNPRGQLGFVTFDTDRLDLYGAIVQQLAAALNTAQLYGEATEGRRLAEEANQIKSRFLSTVSHELRTPLNLIVGLGEILLRDSDLGNTPLPPAARQDIERLNANAQHLGRLIGDVLDLASSDAGQLRLTSQLVDLGQALHMVAEIGRKLAADKGLAWHADLPESGPWVWGDRTRLSQVALNLISNAIKFTMRGEVGLILESGAESVTVSVRDTGLGIAPAEQDAVFAEFRRSERSITHGYGGLGLGLAICQRLIELHGGTIGVDSTGQEGAGSTFHFTLPTVEPPAAQLAAVVPAVAVGQRVLVLTASPATSQRLRDHLDQRGLEVQVALIDQPSGWQSLLMVSPPSAIVLDMSSESDQAWNVLKALKANPLTQGIPVLFYALAQDSGSVLELDYLTKPIELTELTRALDQHWLVSDARHPQRTFLVVDDDPDTLEMHARIVQARAASNRVFKARHGREALTVLQREHIDLVLLDLMMPEMDGFAVLEAMRDHEGTRNIPVIVVTGQTLTETEMARLNRGVTKVLSKGLFSLEETLAHLDAALARKRALSSEAQRLVRQAMAYLHAHYTEPISRQDLANHVGLSDDYLTSCFHKELGLTPIAYLNRYRIQQARQLLKYTHKSITEIALEVGFSDSSYFSRIFHRETGMTPAAYRRA